jgi:hypothetical protein
MNNNKKELVPLTIIFDVTTLNFEYLFLVENVVAVLGD